MNTNHELLNIHQVVALTAIKESSLRNYVKSGYFPKPVKVGVKSTRWLYSDIEQWIASLRKEVVAVA